MSLSKNSLKTSSYSGNKLTFFKPNDQTDMLQTQHSYFSSAKDDELSSCSDLMYEQDCLIKLKDQRLKIQELTYLYQRTQEDLRKQEQKVRKYEIQLQSHEQLKGTKLKYLALTKEFSQIMGQKQMAQNQNQKLKQKLSKITSQYNRVVKGTMLDKMRQKQETNTQFNRYEEFLNDKQDEITRNLHVFQTKQKQNLRQINQLTQVINQLKGDISEIKRTAESEVDQLTGQILKRQTSLEKVKKAMENMKEENSMLRCQLRSQQDQFSSKEQQWLRTQEDLIFQVNSWKRKCSDSEHRANQSKYQLQRCEQKLKQSTQTVEMIKQQLKNSQQASAIALNQISHSYEQKISQSRLQISQLKQSVEELLQVKSIYNKENDLLKQKIMREEDTKRRRRMIVRSELREIQMIQNTVKRIN